MREAPGTRRWMSADGTPQPDNSQSNATIAGPASSRRSRRFRSSRSPWTSVRGRSLQIASTPLPAGLDQLASRDQRSQHVPVVRAESRMVEVVEDRQVGDAQVLAGSDRGPRSGRDDARSSSAAAPCSVPSQRAASRRCCASARRSSPASSMKSHANSSSSIARRTRSSSGGPEVIGEGRTHRSFARRGAAR